MNNFGVNLRELRKSRSLRQEDLASIMNLSRNQINNYENGFSEPDMATQFQLASFFGVSLDTLTGRIDTVEESDLHETLLKVQTTYALLDKDQKKQFCKQLNHYISFLGNTIDELS